MLLKKKEKKEENANAQTQHQKRNPNGYIVVRKLSLVCYDPISH